MPVNGGGTIDVNNYGDNNHTLVNQGMLLALNGGRLT
jgi:hypothetical protein